MPLPYQKDLYCFICTHEFAFDHKLLMVINCPEHHVFHKDCLIGLIQRRHRGAPPFVCYLCHGMPAEGEWTFQDYSPKLCVLATLLQDTPLGKDPLGRDVPYHQLLWQLHENYEHITNQIYRLWREPAANDSLAVSQQVERFFLDNLVQSAQLAHYPGSALAEEVKKLFAKIFPLLRTTPQFLIEWHYENVLLARKNSGDLTKIFYTEITPGTLKKWLRKLRTDVELQGLMQLSIEIVNRQKKIMHNRSIPFPPGFGRSSPAYFTRESAGFIDYKGEQQRQAALLTEQRLVLLQAGKAELSTQKNNELIAVTFLILAISVCCYLVVNYSARV